MPTPPSRVHQDLTAAFASWLQKHWALALGNRVHAQVNVASPGGWPNDYRIPDLILLTPDRFEIDRNEYFEGAPTVAVEIRSPGDESLEKMPFYARLGVPELWIIDRDTRAINLYALQDGQYELQSPAADGWLQSTATGIRLHAEPDDKLAVQIADDQGTRRLLPEN